MADRYKIYEQLGAGGVGTVFRAYDTQLKRWVAIKRLTTKTDADGTEDSQEEELRAEADSLASLRHPNIVTIFDVSSDADGLFIVMELLEGDDLADVVGRGPLHYEDFKELAYQTLEGLLAAHQHHILHRDIKPENIKVDRLPGGRFQATIIDFGLARLGLRARKQTEEVGGTVMGSVHYMAPEQLTRKPVDERTDLYSLGCVFYEALSGKKPFTGKTMAEVVDNHIKHQTIPVHVVAPHVPQWLSAWVSQLISQKPEERPAGAEEAMQTFREWERAQAAPSSAVPVAKSEPVAVAVVPEEPKIAPVPMPEAAPPAAAHPAPAPAPASRPKVRATRGSALPAKKSATSAVAPASAAPAPARSSASPRPASKKKPAAAKKSPLPLVLGIGGGVLALGLGGWFLFSGGGEGSGSSSGSGSGKLPSRYSDGSSNTGRNNDIKLPASRKAPPQAADRLVHFVADAGTTTLASQMTGKVQPVKTPGEAVGEWRDVAPRGKDNTLNAWQKQKSFSPTLVNWSQAVQIPTLQPNLKALQFELTDGAAKALEIPGNRRKSDAAPFGSATVAGSKGVTIAAVFQAQAGKQPNRVITVLGNQTNQFTLRVLANESLVIEANGRGEKTRLESKNVVATRPVLVVASWNAGTGKITLRAANPPQKPGQKGAQFQGNADAPAQPSEVPLDKIHVGRQVNSNAKGPLKDQDRFVGYISELIVYSSALSPEQTGTLLEQQWRPHYFKP